MKIAGGWIGGAVLWVALAGCVTAPKDTLCGNSVGCGNPTKIASLQTVDVNCSGCQLGGVFYPTPFTVRFGENLVIRLDAQFISLADSVKGMVSLYPGLQVPVVSPQPLDSFALVGDSIVLSVADLRKLVQPQPPGSGPFPFSIRITLTLIAKGVVFHQEGLLAGLGVDWDSGKFLASEGNPLMNPGKEVFLTEPQGYYQGDVQSWDSLSAAASAGYIYIPGSPYQTVIEITNGHFRLGALPYSLPFELRMFLVPKVRPGNGKVPVFILQAGPAQDSLPNRPFQASLTGDSLSLPGNLP